MGAGRSVAQLEDTIVAVATPSGRGALALVRLSGPAAFAIAGKHLRSLPAQPRAAQLSTVYDGESHRPGTRNAFPGSRVVHGDDTSSFPRTVGTWFPALCGSADLLRPRQALPGDFTRRAVLNGKLDILRPGHLRLIVPLAGMNVRPGQLDGGLSRRLLLMRDSLIELEALIFYDIDFPEEDTGPSAGKSGRSATAITASLKPCSPLLQLVSSFGKRCCRDRGPPMPASPHSSTRCWEGPSDSDEIPALHGCLEQ